MRKESTVYFRISFRRDEFYLDELFSHLASMKNGKEMSLEIKKILFNRQKLDSHNKFQHEEFKLPKSISFRINISERELWLDPIRKLILATPQEKRVDVVKRIIFDSYKQNSSQTPFFENLVIPTNEAQTTLTPLKEEIKPAIIPLNDEKLPILINNESKSNEVLIENFSEEKITSIKTNAALKSRAMAAMSKFSDT